MRYKILHQLAHLTPDAPHAHLLAAVPHFDALVANGRVEAARKIFAGSTQKDREKFIASIQIYSAGVDNISALIPDFLEVSRASDDPVTHCAVLAMLAYTGQADLLDQAITRVKEKNIEIVEGWSAALYTNIQGRAEKSVQDVLLNRFAAEANKVSEDGKTICDTHYMNVMEEIIMQRFSKTAKDQTPGKKPDDQRLVALIDQERFYSVMLKYIVGFGQKAGLYIFKDDELEYAFQNLPIKKFISIFCNFFGSARPISRDQSIEYFWKIYEKLGTERRKKDFVLRIFRAACISNDGFLFHAFGDINDIDNSNPSQKTAYGWLVSLDENTLTFRQKYYMRLLKGAKEAWESLTKSAQAIQETFTEIEASRLKDPPHPELKHYPEFGFSRDVYDAVLPAMQMAASIEQSGIGPLCAYKLAVLFDDPKKAARFLDVYANHGAKQPIHDLLNYNFCDCGWSPKAWGDLALRYGPKALTLIGRADDIEKELGRAPKSLEEIKEAATKAVYKKSAQFPEFAALCLEHGIAEKVFDKHIKTARKAAEKKTDHIPNIGIDGADYGYPGYSLEKLPCGDLRGLVLGAITDDCQYIGNNGQVCAVHGSVSEFGGFYVLRKTDKKGKKNIVGQSWVWIGSKGEVVFDSIEVMAEAYHAPAVVLYKMAADQMIADGKFKEIRLGAGGRTPVNLPFPIIQAEEASVPMDIPPFRYVDPDTGQRSGDSLMQYSLAMISVSNDNPASQKWADIIRQAQEFAEIRAGAGQPAQIRLHDERQLVATR